MANFRRDNDFSNIVSSFSRDSDPRFCFGIYSKGYHNAAKALTHLFINESADYPFPNTDYNGYPIVFLYRHSFELSLKNIIYQGVRLATLRNLNNASDELRKSHNLIHLSNLAAETIVTIFPKDNSLRELLVDVKETAKEFSNYDKDSYAYRYPIDVNGNPSTREHEILNLYSLSTQMDKLLTALQSVDFGLTSESFLEEMHQNEMNTFFPAPEA